MLHHIKELIQKKLDSKAGKTGESETVSCRNKTRVKRAFHKADSRRQETRKNMTCRKAETATSLGRSMMEMPDTGIQQPIQQNQYGRTMVEMLGVLVIIGVLSIGALAGYRYGMDKHRASETINDINARGVDLIIQASRNIPLNLDEWGDKSSAGYTFGTPEWTTEGTIALDISGLPERVCEMVVDGLSSQFDMDINGARIDTDATCGEENKITVYFEGGAGDGACKDVICGECELCVDGLCKTGPENMVCTGGYCQSGICIKEERPKFTDGKCTTATIATDCIGGDLDCVGCSTGGWCDTWSKEGQDCHADDTGEAGICNKGQCQIGSCQTNNDCGNGYFCADTNEKCEEAHPSKCQKLYFVQATITLSDGTSETWYASKYRLSWWDAKNACDRLGKQMATPDDMVVAWSGSKGRYTLTERAEKLNEAIGDFYDFWLSGYFHSCSPFVIRLSNSSLSNASRERPSALALCH